jgi:MFS family permease
MAWGRAAVMQQAVRDESSPAYRGWRVVAACFLIAFFIFGFGLYGQGVYLAELQRTLGWSATLISGASTFSFLIGSVLLVFTNEALARLGPRWFVLAGIAALTASTTLLTFTTAFWQLYLAYVLMAFGWFGMGTVVIATVLNSWFERRRGLAISLAFTGATCGGIVLAPLLLLLAGAIGFRSAMLSMIGVMIVVLVPIVLALIDWPSPAKPAPRPQGAATAGALSRGELLRTAAFWTITAPFAIALLAQVGFIVHQVSFLEPILGRYLAGLAVTATTAMAVIGRLCLGLFVDHVDPRWTAAVSLTSQAGALLILLLTSNPTAMLVACAIYGFSIGNLITLPPLIIQREVGQAAFGTVLGLSTAIGGVISALGPGILGLVRSLTGGYAAALLLCLTLKLVATIIVLLRAFSGRPLGRALS